MEARDDPGPTGPASLLLQKWQEGDDAARSELLALLYEELRKVARGLMRRERSGHTLAPTAVVNEACLRLLHAEDTPSASRSQFLGLAARVMRQVLVDHSRRRDSDKRGGDWQRVSLAHDSESELAPSEVRAVDALDLHRALERLTALSERQASVAELRYFGGLTVPECAEVLGISPTLVKREWQVARLWLKRELEGGESELSCPDNS
ncbi:MAG: ECF-type sigma factor [Acidobacteriota bacterium]